MFGERFGHKKNLQKFQKFKAFKRALFLGFCAEILSHFLKCFQNSLILISFSTYILELQSYSLFYRAFVREENFFQERVCGLLTTKKLLVIEIVELGTPVIL